VNYLENVLYRIKSRISETTKILKFPLHHLLILVGSLLTVLPSGTFDRNLVTAAVRKNGAFPISSVNSIINSDVTTSDLHELDANNPMSQINSVSELEDIQSNNWTIQVLQSLVKRYGCIAENLDEDTINRYEFAATLNTCLIHINKIIATGTANFVAEEDWVNLQKLQGEFAKELAILTTHVDTLEARIHEVRKNQFSTTIKLFGETIFAVTGVLVGAVGSNNSAFQNRVRFNFQTSFTGQDLLNTRLDAGNAPTFTLRDYTAEGVQTFNLTYLDNKVNIGWLAY
jgi:Carbohydrate-selective porin, OprB family